MLSFRRFDSGNVKANSITPSWSYSGSSDDLTLTVSKAVLFHGVRLFGDSGCSQYEVNLKIKDENVTGTYTSQQDGDGVPGYDVMLSKPIFLLPDEKVTISATMDRLPYRQKFLNDRNSKICYHSLKDHPKVSKIAKFRCELL